LENLRTLNLFEPQSRKERKGIDIN